MPAQATKRMTDHKARSLVVIPVTAPLTGGTVSRVPCPVHYHLGQVLRAAWPTVAPKPSGQLPLREVGAEQGTAVRITDPLPDEHFLIPDVTVIGTQPRTSGVKRRAILRRLGGG
jgi:hypothetical protein